MQLRNKLILLSLLVCSQFSWAGVPDWLRAVAHESLPTYKADTSSVLLLHEEVTTVDNNGEIHTLYREAVKILRPNARKEASEVLVGFDNETKITYLKGWSITASGQEFEVKEKDAVELNASYSEFISDSRMKALEIPGADVGSVIGYEYQQRRRPSVNEDIWTFQSDVPVRLSRYVLHLPQGWEYETFWDNHDKVSPTGTNTDVTWQVTDVNAIEEEDDMPPHRAIAGRMLLHFFGPGQHAQNSASWATVGSWYGKLISDRRTPTPELTKQAQTLTANSKSALEKISVLSAWVQKEVRYVAVEVGIGGYQPHAAGDIFRTRYGDCKDKVTLLSAMLKAVGIDSNYILIHSVRGLVREESPSAKTFNHVILAVQLPRDIPPENWQAVYTHPKLGKLLLFDPTDNMTPLGLLPSSLQQSNALLITDTGGELIHMPLLPADSNRLRRTAKLKIAPDGSLSGQVEEERTGALGSDFRGQMLSLNLDDRAKRIEATLNGNLSDYRLTQAETGNLDKVAKPVFVRYSFTVPQYAKKAGALLLVRPRILGQKNWSVMEGNKRLYPVEYDNTSYQTDNFDIELPGGFEVDEVPDPVDLVYDFGEYHSKVEQEGNALKYSRQFIIKQVIVPTSRLDDLRKFYRQIATDERSTAVLKPKLSQGN